MEPVYDFGMIGIGVMGSNLLLNMADKGFATIGFDLKQERAEALEKAATPGTIVKGTIDNREMVQGLKKPRKIMMLVPAGKPVDSVIESLLPLLEEGDILIDGGNSFYKDTLTRVAYLQPKGIHFFGMGVSGGELGARLGPSLMPGGDQAAYQYLKPILESIAAKAEDGKPCVAYMGAGAAGHYVKMVHNGIEYALMQMLSEAYDLLHRAGACDNRRLHQIFTRFNKGPLQSFLLEVTADIFATGDNETASPDDFLVDKILDQAGSKGTGKWTSQDAMDLGVPVPTIDMAVAMRSVSVFKEQRVEAAALYKNNIGRIEVSESFLTDLEAALGFAFIVAYAQGLSQLARASVDRAMQIPLPAVVQVWRSGCIIRSSLLPHFYTALQEEGDTENLLLHPGIAGLLQEREAAARRILAQAIAARIPFGCIGNALAYFDAFCSERLPTNLIQAQRDYFGAHTYKRIDKEGVFHTTWNAVE